jgi:hypothetical protein
MNINLWEGGCPQPPIGVDCGDCKQNGCPGPHKMAAHRRRAPYNMGGAFDPACDVRNQPCYALLEAGDTVWMALIPEDAIISGVRDRVTGPDDGGLTYTPIIQEIDLDTCAPVGEAIEIGAGPQATAACFARWTAQTGLYANPCVPSVGPPPTTYSRHGYLVGLRLDALPAGGANEFRGRVELTVVAMDFETVSVADCRLNGPCVINNP